MRCCLWLSDMYMYVLSTGALGEPYNIKGPIATTSKSPNLHCASVKEAPEKHPLVLAPGEKARPKTIKWLPKEEDPSEKHTCRGLKFDWALFTATYNGVQRAIYYYK